MNLNYTKQKKRSPPYIKYLLSNQLLIILFVRLHNLFCSFQKSAVLHLGIAPSKITNFPPFLTLQLKKSTAFGEGLCFKLKYPTQKLYQFFSLFIIFINSCLCLFSAVMMS